MSLFASTSNLNVLDSFWSKTIHLNFNSKLFLSDFDVKFQFKLNLQIKKL